MFSSKGQVTIFVILGVVLIAGSLMFLNLISSEDDVDEGVDDSVLYSVLYSVSACAESSLFGALVDFELLTSESEFLDEAGGEVSFIVFEGDNLFPGEDEIESLLGDLFESNFLVCVESLKEEFHFSLEDFEGNINLFDNQISYDGEVSLNLLSDDITITERDISTSLTTSFKEDMELLRSFSYDQSSDPEMFNIGLLSEISFLTGDDYYLYFNDGSFFVNFLFYDEETDIKRGVWFAVN